MKLRITGSVATVIVLSALQASPQSLADGYPVVLDGHSLFMIKAPRAPYSAEQRAKNISDDLRAVAEDRRVHTSEMRIVPGETDSILLGGHTFILAVTDADAQLENRSRELLAQERQQVIERAIEEYRRVREPWIIIRKVLLVFLYWTIVALLLYASKLLKHRIGAWIRACCQRLLEQRNLHGINSVFGKQFHGAVVMVSKFARALFAALVMSLAASYSLRLFPETAGVSQRVLDSLRSAVALAAKAFAGYLPNLGVILMVIIATYGLIRIIGALSKAMKSGAITVPGFHCEWVEQTRKLLVLFSVMFALVIIFPYLPGGDSPAFRGASIFLGVLVSLGSSTAMGNVVAGIILTYMRPFHVGDRVKISDTVGDVIDRSLLVTRLRTVKNVSTIIPNSMILGAHILNYSAEAKSSGIIVHTSITIGYDAPWRTVHRLLIDAALETNGILSEPKPYVLQTSLNDFHVSYEINAFTNASNEIHRISPELHEHIQDEFNRAGIEIMSPSYFSMRDGNAVTIPEAERTTGYSAPSFRVHLASDGDGSKDIETKNPSNKACLPHQKG